MARKLVRFEPLRDAMSLRDEMDRLFDAVAGRTEREPNWAPPMDIEETKESVVVRAEVPGMKKDDIKISLSGDVLSICGERKWESEQEDKTWHRIERAYGKFQRSLVLPSDVEGDKAKASYQDGILQLTLPKSDRAKSREISIDS
jgi:HSP20 family protein